jgi:putative spermidine/putrescine transport system substrate-binding protein
MKWTIGILAAGAMVLQAWVGSSSAQTRELVVATWGGAQEEGWRKSLSPSLEKKYGARIVWVAGFSSQTLAKLRAQKDNPQIDIAILDDGPHYQAVTLGLVERLDRSKVPNMKDLYDLAFETNDYGVAFAVSATCLFYNTKMFAENKWAPVNSWLDLFRPEFKGKVITQNIANSNGLNLFLMLNKISGGTDSNVEPGFAKMRELVPQVITFDRIGETPTVVQQGVVAVGTWSIEQVANFAGIGIPIQAVFPKEGFYGYKEIVTIVGPNQDLAYKFVDHILSKEQQEDTAKFTFQPGPQQAGSIRTRPSVLSMVPRCSARWWSRIGRS